MTRQTAADVVKTLQPLCFVIFWLQSLTSAEAQPHVDLSLIVGVQTSVLFCPVTLCSHLNLAVHFQTNANRTNTAVVDEGAVIDQLRFKATR